MSSSSAESPTTSTNSSTKSLSELNEADYETALFEAHRKAKRLARTDTNTAEVLIAKLAVLAIRQLHATDVYPRTAIRAMVHMEFDEENRSTGGAIARARRDIRNEGRVRRAQKEAEENGAKDAKVAEGTNGEAEVKA